MSSQELSMWYAYYHVEPFGPWRDDLRTGILGAKLGTLWLAKGKGFCPADFMPKFGEPAKAMTDGQIRDACTSFFAKLKAKKNGH